MSYAGTLSDQKKKINKKIPIIHKRNDYNKWVLWSELTKKSNDGFHKLYAFPYRIDVDH